MLNENGLLQRYMHLDVVCGVLVVYMMFYHASFFANAESFCEIQIINRIFFFFMPWFFFKAGIFYKPDQKISLTLRKSFKRLIIPWIIYSFVGLFIWIVAQIINESCNFSILAFVVKREVAK